MVELQTKNEGPHEVGAFNQEKARVVNLREPLMVHSSSSAVLWLGSVLVRLGRLTYLFAYLGLAKGRLSSL